MNTGTFRSSIDWSHELVNSIVWVLAAFAITAPCLLVVLVVIGRMTEWGRQFWRITGDYFTGRQSVPVWAMLALLLLSTIITVRINVLSATTPMTSSRRFRSPFRESLPAETRSRTRASTGSG